MHDIRNFYIDGRWAEPLPGSRTHPIVDPATDQPIGQVALGSAADVDRAVAAAQAAFPAWAATSREERMGVLQRLVDSYKEKAEAIAQSICDEIGAPLWLCRQVQAPVGLAQLATTLAALKDFAFESREGSTQVMREPIGVAALITPWNWPMNQVAAKVAPALAAGCTMVLKPSEIAPLNAQLFAQACHDAGVPPGVFNMVHGDGPSVGHALSTHPGVDMVSITGSTRAGVQVAIDAAPGVKRVTQELGGKSANILLPDTDFDVAVAKGVLACMLNSGQTCTAPTRMLVPRERYAAVLDKAHACATSLAVGDPRLPETKLGPVSSRLQFDRVQRMIEAGISEGARVIAGGAGRPAGLDRGCFVQPTVFGHVHNRMRIAREEIFGPVLAVIPYRDEDDAVAIANDSDYGLAGYVWSADLERARGVARRLRTGSVRLNETPYDFSAPFGGFRQSGNGREFGRYGIAEFLEYKAIMG